MQQTPRITTQQHQSRDDKQYHEKLQHVVRRGDTFNCGNQNKGNRNFFKSNSRKHS